MRGNLYEKNSFTLDTAALRRQVLSSAAPRRGTDSDDATIAATIEYAIDVPDASPMKMPPPKESASSPGVTKSFIRLSMPGPGFVAIESFALVIIFLE